MEEHTKQAFVMLRQEATELLALFDRLCCDTAPATPMQGNEVEPVRAHPPQTGDVTRRAASTVGLGETHHGHVVVICCAATATATATARAGAGASRYRPLTRRHCKHS